LVGPWLRCQRWEGPERQKIEAVLAYALKLYPGVPISAVGVCWGGYAAFDAVRAFMTFNFLWT
jgi:dienelactone hydrolase